METEWKRLQLDLREKYRYYSCSRYADVLCDGGRQHKAAVRNSSKHQL